MQARSVRTGAVFGFARRFFASSSAAGTDIARPTDVARTRTEPARVDGARRPRIIAQRLAALAIAAAWSTVGVGLGGCDESPADLAIVGIEPRTGPLQADQPVKVTGHGFRGDIGYTIHFGTKKASSVTIIDSETLLVAAPGAEDPGMVDIHFRADNGPAFRIADAYRYENMAGSVVEGLGENKAPSKNGNLQY